MILCANMASDFGWNAIDNKETWKYRIENLRNVACYAFVDINGKFSFPFLAVMREPVLNPQLDTTE